MRMDFKNTIWETAFKTHNMIMLGSTMGSMVCPNYFADCHGFNFTANCLIVNEVKKNIFSTLTPIQMTVLAKLTKWIDGPDATQEEKEANKKQVVMEQLDKVLVNFKWIPFWDVDSEEIFEKAFHRRVSLKRKAVEHKK